MSDNDDPPPVSGNRWEPAGGTTPETPPATEPGTDPAAEPTAAASVPPAAYAGSESAASPSRPTWLTRARAGVAGGAAAVLLAGGLGGFALGRATAGDSNDGRVDRNGVTTGFDQDGDHGFPGGPGGPQLGQLPDGGQLPGPPGQDDGAPDDGTDGSDT